MSSSQLEKSSLARHPASTRRHESREVVSSSRRGAPMCVSFRSQTFENREFATTRPRRHIGLNLRGLPVIRSTPEIAFHKPTCGD